MGYNLNLNGDEINRFGQEWDPNEDRHMAQCGSEIQLKLKLGQKRNYSIKWLIFLLSTEFRWSVCFEPRMKVHRLDEGYTWVLENRDFTKDPRGEISGNRSFRV